MSPKNMRETQIIRSKGEKTVRPISVKFGHVSVFILLSGYHYYKRNVVGYATVDAVHCYILFLTC